MERSPKRVEFYQTLTGRQPFQEWLESLKDREGRAKIKVKIERVALGNFGDAKNTLIVLLCGGDKSTQGKDIDLAKEYWADYKKRTNEKKSNHGLP